MNITRISIALVVILSCMAVPALAWVDDFESGMDLWSSNYSGFAMTTRTGSSHSGMYASEAGATNGWCTASRGTGGDTDGVLAFSFRFMGPAYGGALILLAANGNTNDEYHVFDGNGPRFYWEFDGNAVYFNHRSTGETTQSASVGISLATWYDYRLTLAGAGYTTEYKLSSDASWSTLRTGTTFSAFQANTVGISSYSGYTGGHRVDDIGWTPAAVPEPSALASLGGCLIGLAGMSLRRKR